MKKRKASQGGLAEGQCTLLRFFGNGNKDKGAPSGTRVCVREIDLTIDTSAERNRCLEGEPLSSSSDNQAEVNMKTERVVRKGRVARRSSRSSFTTRKSNEASEQNSSPLAKVADQASISNSTADHRTTIDLTEEQEQILTEEALECLEELVDGSSLSQSTTSTSPQPTRVIISKVAGRQDVNACSADEAETKSDSATMLRREPYYLANFKLILSTVLGDSEYEPLFNNSDMDIMGRFLALPG